MSHFTQSIWEVIRGELAKSCKNNEFFHNGRLTYNNDVNDFLRKVQTFDDDVYKITNRMFFNGVQLENKEADRIYKQMFVLENLYEEMNFQTVGNFRTHVMAIFLRESPILNAFIGNIEDYINNQNSSTSGVDSKSRSAVRTLPQEQASFDLASNEFGFSDSGSGNNSEIKSNSTSLSNDVDNLEKIIAFFEKRLKIYKKKKCFMGVLI